MLANKQLVATNKQLFLTNKELIDICDKSNKYIVDTVMSICVPITKEEMSNHYGINNCDEIATKYGLNIQDNFPFANCPVSAFKLEKSKISIFAVSLAYLVIAKSEDKTIDKEILLNRLLNTIIVTGIKNKDNSPDCFSWPVDISIEGSTSSGTSNQTCIALSTLLRAGFLKQNQAMEYDVLKKRYELVIRALRWLIKNQNRDGSWTYGEMCVDINETSIDYAVLPSHYCYENIRKYIDFFNSPNGSNEIAGTVGPKIIDEMHDACKRFENWVEGAMEEPGGFYLSNLHREHLSPLHTCLCHIIYFYNYDVSRLDLTKFMKTTGYVFENFKMLRSAISKGKNSTEEYRYKYETKDGVPDYKDDKYEIVTEFLYITYSTRLLKSNYAWYLDNKQKKQLKILNYYSYRSLLGKLGEMNSDGKNLFVYRGDDNAREYPIYGLYDAQVCLLELLKSKNDRGEIPILYSPLKERALQATQIGILVVLLAIVVRGFVRIIAQMFEMDENATVICLLGGMITGLITGIVTGTICDYLGKTNSKK